MPPAAAAANANDDDDDDDVAWATCILDSPSFVQATY